MSSGPHAHPKVVLYISSPIQLLVEGLRERIAIVSNRRRFQLRLRNDADFESIVSDEREAEAITVYDQIKDVLYLSTFNLVCFHHICKGSQILSLVQSSHAFYPKDAVLCCTTGQLRLEAMKTQPMRPFPHQGCSSQATVMGLWSMQIPTLLCHVTRYNCFRNMICILRQLKYTVQISDAEFAGTFHSFACFQTLSEAIHQQNFIVSEPVT